MKKFLSVLAISIFAGISAQTEFGVKAGYNLSGMKLQDMQLQKKSYFYVGGLAEHRLRENLSLQYELLFTQVGGSFSEELYDYVAGQIIPIGVAHIKIKNTQLQLPIAAKYYFTQKFSLSAGVNFGFNLSKKFESDFHIDGAPTSGDTDLFKTVNIAPIIGTEFKINENLFVDARYHFGVFNSSVSDAPKTKISILQAGLGYRFK